MNIADNHEPIRTPREIVEQLDKHIVGQANAKRAVAIAIRNRWRRQQLDEELRREVAPKNILMIGSTGVGKTEIARRLARLTGAPFVKVEASKYTEVGYYGRDVESMVRDLVENAIGIVRAAERERVKEEAQKRTDKRLLDLLCPQPVSYEYTSVAQVKVAGSDEEGNETDPDETVQQAVESRERTREKMKQMLDSGDLEEREIEMTIESKSAPIMMGSLGGGGIGGMDNMDMDLQGMFEKIMPKNQVTKKIPVHRARTIIFDQECDRLLDDEKINSQAIELAENLGIVFLDEIDKVVSSEGKGADVSRMGVQRDLLPIVEGTTVQTRYGYINTDHVLFVAAGAFHRNRPSDLMPELQGRFPIRVELDDLTTDDFVRILKEPKNSLTRQYEALLNTEGVKLTFTDDAIQELATFAAQVNQTTQNIGARRLHTILERLLEELSFESPDMQMGNVEINAEYVKDRLSAIAENEDLSRFIL